MSSQSAWRDSILIAKPKEVLQGGTHVQTQFQSQKFLVNHIKNIT